MIWADYLVLLCAVVIIASVLMQNSSDDIKDAFSGEKSELFKNQKQRGAERILFWVTLFASILFIVFVFVSNGIDRFL
jgi:preprotein translocase subunit SecG